MFSGQPSSKEAGVSQKRPTKLLKTRNSRVASRVPALTLCNSFNLQHQGRGNGVGRGRGVGGGLTVAVGVAEGVTLGVTDGVTVAVAVAVGVGVGLACGQKKISVDASFVTPSVE